MIHLLSEYETWQVMKDYKGLKREDNSLVDCKIWIRGVQNPSQSPHLMISHTEIPLSVTQIISRQLKMSYQKLCKYCRESSLKLNHVKLLTVLMVGGVF